LKAQKSKSDPEVALKFHKYAFKDLFQMGQADRAISTGKLHALLRFHTRPINVVVFHGSQGNLVLRWVSRLDAFSGYPVRT
jgi:hypothetical protein